MFDFKVQTAQWKMHIEIGRNRFEPMVCGVSAQMSNELDKDKPRIGATYAHQMCI